MGLGLCLGLGYGDDQVMCYISPLRMRKYHRDSTGSSWTPSYSYTVGFAISTGKLIQNISLVVSYFLIIDNFVKLRQHYSKYIFVRKVQVYIIFCHEQILFYNVNICVNLSFQLSKTPNSCFERWYQQGSVTVTAITEIIM